MKKNVPICGFMIESGEVDFMRDNGYQLLRTGLKKDKMCIMPKSSSRCRTTSDKILNEYI